MNRNPVGWFEIYADDIERAKTFYQNLLAVKLDQLTSPEDVVTQMWAFPMDPQAAGSSGALVKMQNERPSGNGVIVYFSCDDCAVEAGRATTNGGSIMKDKFSIGQYGFIALVNDTEGNVIGLHSMK